MHGNTVHRSHKLHFSTTFSLKMGLTSLFTHLKNILLQCFQFSIFNFSKINYIQTDPQFIKVTQTPKVVPQCLMEFSTISTKGALNQFSIIFKHKQRHLSLSVTQQPQQTHTHALFHLVDAGEGKLTLTSWGRQFGLTNCSCRYSAQGRKRAELD